MGEDTKIQWCHHTFNPWRGCTKVSAGCAHCYAETLSKRNPGVLGVWGESGTRVVASESMWRQPLKWDKEAKAAGVRRRVFCASLADVFEDREELDVHRRRLFRLIRATLNLDWLLLTKRPDRVARILRRCLDRWESRVQSGKRDADYWWVVDWMQNGQPSGRVPDNVWLGASVENRAAKRRIDLLRETPAAVRFLSIEPLLEDMGELDLTGIHWVIVGGESGPHARWCDLAWIRSVVAQCEAAGVAVFVKQLGASPFDSAQRISIDGPDSHAITVDLRDPKGGDPSEWPADLRVREMPRVQGADANEGA